LIGCFVQSAEEGRLAALRLASKEPEADIFVCVRREPAGQGTMPTALSEAGDTFISERQSARTIADGLATARSAKSSLVAEYPTLASDEIVTVSEESIVRAMRMIWEVDEDHVEPSAAVSYAALLETSSTSQASASASS